MARNKCAWSWNEWTNTLAQIDESQRLYLDRMRKAQEISAPQSYPDACKDVRLQPEATDGEQIGVPQADISI